MTTKAAATWFLRLEGLGAELSRPLSVTILAGAAISNLLRAWRLPLLHDEALTYNVYLQGDWQSLFDPLRFSANHHIFHTYLARLSVALLGSSELAIRLPSLLGGFFYLLTVYRFSGAYFGRSVLRVLTVGVLALNPLVRDFTFVARGYGLGLAFSFCAFDILLGKILMGAEEHAGSKPFSLLGAAVAIALSTASVLTFAILNTSTVIVFTAWALIGAKARGGGRAVVLREAGRIILCLALPAAAIFAALVVMPMRGAREANFYFGTPHLLDSVSNLTGVSVRSGDYTGWKFLPASGLRPLLQELATRGTFAATAALPFALAAVVIRLKKSQRGRRDIAIIELAFLFAGATYLGAVLLHVLIHHTLGVLYPLDRTGLHLVAIFTLALCLGVGAFCQTVPRQSLPWWPGPVLLGALALNYVFELNMGPPPLWRYDSGTRDLVRSIDSSQLSPRGREARIGIDWLIAPTARYYYTADRMIWRARAESVDPSPTGKFPSGLDFYLLRDVQAARSHGLGVLYMHPLSREVLAVPVLMERNQPEGKTDGGVRSPN